MTFAKLLIANRGEIASRIAAGAADLGIATVAVHSEDDAAAAYLSYADEAVALRGTGPAAYLDVDQLVAVARRTGCDAVHPGYGFLSERATFAAACVAAKLTFVGPPAAVLDLLGDKAQARSLAVTHGVPVVPGTSGPTTVAEARSFWDARPGAALMVKAVAGGGGRGMRAVHTPDDLDEAFARCAAEATAAFGRADLYVEQVITGARHIEVQIVADEAGTVVHLGERECTLQRRHQKLIEVAPSPSLDDAGRAALTDAAVLLARAAGYRGLGTFEFLVPVAPTADGETFFFLEANPRLQVEHTVTEAVTGIDLVQLQLQLAAGESLHALGRATAPQPNGCAVQARVNAETVNADGVVHPATGRLAVFDLPAGPGIRVDTAARTGSAPNPRFDTLLAKIIVHVPAGGFDQARRKLTRALDQTRIEGVATNLALLRALVRDPAVTTGHIDTAFVDTHLPALLATAATLEPPAALYASATTTTTAAATTAADVERVPLDLPPGAIAVAAPTDGIVVAVEVADGDLVRRNQPVVILESMKMQHPVPVPDGGHVHGVRVVEGDVVRQGDIVAVLVPSDVGGDAAVLDDEIDLDRIRPDLAELLERLTFGHDEGRPEAVAKRRARGHRTMRENLDDLLDPGSFIEYGALVVAAQRRRRPLDDLIRNSPADGIITGIGTVNGERCMVLAYDYMVMAGTQGVMGHKKLDRMLHLAQQWRLPVVLFAEGGGGRPNDTDWAGVAGLDTSSFIELARLSGLVPLVGVVSGRCFAGNAALLGCCDVIIATEDASIGMGGPAMIEGGGLGVVAPDDVGPVSVQAPNGVIDVVVADEAEAVAVTRRYLDYLQHDRRKDWSCADQRHLRHVIPEDRLRSYDMRVVIDALADTGSVLELRAAFGTGIITALVRIEGRPFGLFANNPRHLGGAIDAPAADKAARFLQLCDAFGLPVISLCDTPGFMVGPETEKTATVRHVSRMFVVSGALRVPCFTIVTRKGYGLGAQAMAAGSFAAPFFIASWPSGEFGGMGLEGAVRLGFGKDLDAIEDPDEREALFRKMVDLAYDGGRALNMASFLEIDAVIDPVDTRRWLLRGLDSVPPAGPRTEADRRIVDPW